MKKLGFATLVASATLLLATQAPAAALVSITQTGSDVVVSGSGSLRTTGLTLLNTAGIGGVIGPAAAAVRLGSATMGSVNVFSATFSPGGTFGTGSAVAPTSGTGDIFGLSGGGGTLFAPVTYVSGSALTGSSTYANATFASLGITPGTYTYNYIAGGVSDTITITAVPEPSTWIMVLGGVGMLGATIYRRRLVRA